MGERQMLEPRRARADRGGGRSCCRTRSVPTVRFLRPHRPRGAEVEGRVIDIADFARRDQIVVDRRVEVGRELERVIEDGLASVEIEVGVVAQIHRRRPVGLAESSIRRMPSDEPIGAGGDERPRVPVLPSADMDQGREVVAGAASCQTCLPRPRPPP